MKPDIYVTYLNVNKAHYPKYCQILFTVNFYEVKEIKPDYMKDYMKDKLTS